MGWIFERYDANDWGRMMSEINNISIRTASDDEMDLTDNLVILLNATNHLFLAHLKGLAVAGLMSMEDVRAILDKMYDEVLRAKESNEP